MIKKIFITGATGFLAKHLSHFLIKQGHELFGLSDQLPENVNFEVLQGDIRDYSLIEKIYKEFKPDIILHLAAVSSVGMSWRDPVLTYDVNIMGSAVVLHCAKKIVPQAKIVIMSSAELFGNCNKDNSGDNIGNPYALSKKTMELIADLLVKSESMNIIKLRSFNFTGPGQSPNFVSSDFARQIAEIEAGKKDPKIYTGNLQALRDFSDVRDIARYISIIVLDDRKINQDYIEVCSGKVFSIEDILNILISLSSKKIEHSIQPSKLRPIEIDVLKGDNTFIKDVLKLSPLFSMKDTLKDLLDYWREQLKEKE